jgi:hypothetical protein
MDLVIHSTGQAHTGYTAFDRKHICVDVTIVDPTAPSHITGRSNVLTPGSAAKAAAQEKINHYQVEEFDSASYTLTPLALESYGRWGEPAQQLLQGLATHIAGGPGCDKVRRGRILYHIRQRLSVALQRQLAGRILRHLQEVRRRHSGGPPAMAARGDLNMGVMGLDLFGSDDFDTHPGARLGAAT